MKIPNVCRFLVIVAILYSLVLASCAQPLREAREVVETVVVEKMVEVEEASMEMAPSAQVEDLPLEASQSQSLERVIIRQGQIVMQVQDTLGAKESIASMVAEMAAQGAFVVSSREYGGGENRSPYIDMSIRVPATRFDEVMDRLARLAVVVDDRNETAQDVTEEYVDIKSRLESMEAARDRLLEIMTDADTTEDLLQAEQQLTQREAEIESLKGRLQYLTQAARLSMIAITLQPYILSQPVESRWRPAETARLALESLVDSARGFGDFLIYFTISILPWLVVIGLVIYGAVRFFRRRRAKKVKETTES